MTTNEELAAKLEEIAGESNVLFDSEIATLREAATRLRAGEAVSVKPLEWKKSSDSEGDIWHGRCSFLGLKYSVRTKVWCSNVNPEWQTVVDENTAKAAAQADYESRILSALTTDPRAAIQAKSQPATGAGEIGKEGV